MIRVQLDRLQRDIGLTVITPVFISAGRYHLLVLGPGSVLALLTTLAYLCKPVLFVSSV